jgi:hypothetical protein
MSLNINVYKTMAPSKNMKINLAILSLMILALVINLNLSSAISELPPVKQNECINLPQTCTSCTYNNISAIQAPNNLTYALRGDYAMTKVGSTYNYTFCNTSIMGTYLVTGYGDLDGTKTGWDYSFKVNGSGQDITNEQMYLMAFVLVGLLVGGLFFFVLSYMFKYPGVKLFFMTLATITLVTEIGLLTYLSLTYLTEFTGITAYMNAYYYVLLTLSGGAMIFLVGWLIYYAFTMFYKSKNLIPDD